MQQARTKHHRMVWIARDHKDHFVPAPLQWAGTPSTPSPIPPGTFSWIWPWMFPQVEQGKVFDKAVVPRFEKVKAACNTDRLNLNKKPQTGGQRRAQISCRHLDISLLILQDEGFTLKTLSFSDPFWFWDNFFGLKWADCPKNLKTEHFHWSYSREGGSNPHLPGSLQSWCHFIATLRMLSS